MTGVVIVLGGMQSGGCTWRGRGELNSQVSNERTTDIMLAEKVQPIGVCDLCLQPIPADIGAWTSKGRPRLHCSRECRNTANSRTGAPLRAVAMQAHVQAGEWQNPHLLHPPTPAEQAARARLGRQREVQAGRWRNPGKTPEARAINSQPEKHSGDLAAAIERLKAGARVADLAPEQQAAHRAYRRELAAARRSALTETERAAQRAKWRAAYRRRRTA